MKRDDLNVLFLRPHRAERSVLSVYLTTDQTQQPNLNRGFEKQLREMTAHALGAADASEHESLVRAAERASAFVAAHTPSGAGLVLFFDAVDEFFWHGDIGFPVENAVRWDRELFLQPLANAVDELEGYGVVLADRASMRLFHVFLGRLDEVGREKLSDARVRHIKSVGRDQSPSRVQHKADDQVKLNLREVAAAARKLMQEKKLSRLILAGTPEVTAELRGLLPKPIERTVIAAVHLSMHATSEEVLSATRPVAEEYERDTELKSVERVVTAAAKTEQAVVGLKRTLDAVNAGRVWQLLYSADLLSPGFECPSCASLFTAKRNGCEYCGSKLRRVPNVIEHAVEHAMRKGARVEVVNGKASESLSAAGGIGALLRARTGTAHA